MNFKGISAPLNAGRLEQLLGLVPSHRTAEAKQPNGRPAGADSADGLETENLFPPSAYAQAAATMDEMNRPAPLIVS